MVGGSPNSSEKVSNNFNAAMEFSQSSISSAILLNGAAATAILAFFSGGGASNPPIALDVLRTALRDRTWGRARRRRLHRRFPYALALLALGTRQRAREMGRVGHSMWLPSP